MESLASSQGESLGDLATNMVMELTTPSDNSDADATKIELIYALPILSVYGQIEQSYISLRKDAIEKR